MILGYPFIEKKLWVKNELVWLGFPIDVAAKMRNFRSETSFFARKSATISKLKNPSVNQVQSAAGSLQWVSQMCLWLRPFLACLYAFFENRGEFEKNWQKNRRLRVKIWEIFLKSPRFPTLELF